MRRALLIVTLLAGASVAPAVARAQLPERIDPVELGDDMARVRLSLIGQLQLRLTTDDNGDAELEPRLRRVRPIVHATFFEGRLASRLHVEANPENPELIDAWIELTLLDSLRIRAGQLKIPFTDYWQRSLTQMAVDWPLTNRWFGGERQLGAMAHGVDPSGWRYAVGVFSGQNRRYAFARELARYYGDPADNPSSLLDPQAPDEMHAEIVGRVAHHSEGVHARGGMDLSGEDHLRHAVALSFAWDTDPVRGRDFALRLAPEALLEIAGFSLTVVGYAGFVETGAPGAESFDLGALGLLAELGWHAHRHLELIARYSRVGITDALREDAGATLTGRHEATFAVHVPILGRGLVVQADVGWLRSEHVDQSAQDEMRARLQLQLAF